MCFLLQLYVIVDESGVKYVGEEHAKHLVSILKEDYLYSDRRLERREVQRDHHWLELQQKASPLINI